MRVKILYNQVSTNILSISRNGQLDCPFHIWVITYALIFITREKMCSLNMQSLNMVVSFNLTFLMVVSFNLTFLKVIDKTGDRIGALLVSMMALH